MENWYVYMCQEFTCVIYLQCSGQADGNMRCVVLMSTRDIEIGEELYSSYLTLVHNEKYNQT